MDRKKEKRKIIIKTSPKRLEFVRGKHYKPVGGILLEGGYIKQRSKKGKIYYRKSYTRVTSRSKRPKKLL